MLPILRRAGFRAGLREHLMLVVLVAMLPLGILAGLLLVHSWQLQQRDVRAGVLHNAQTLATTVRSELDGNISKLELLALAESLEPQSLAAFHTHAAEVVAASPEWEGVALIGPAGEQLLNTTRPYGADLPNLGALPFRRVFETGQPVVSDLLSARAGRDFRVAVMVPVMRDGQVAYALAGLIAFSRLERLLRNESTAAGVAAILDGEHRFVWRSRDPERFRGQPGTTAFVQAARAAPSGAGVFATLEGDDVYGAWAPVPGTTWRTSYGIPAAPMQAALRRSLVWMALAWSVCAFVGLGLATFLSRRLASAIAAAADTARQASSGQPVASADSTVREVHELNHAMREASLRVQHEAAARAAAEAAQQQLLAVEQTARARAEADNRAKDEFLAMLGHELRNPLAAIMNASQVVARLAPGAPEAQPANAVIARQAEHLRRIIDDLLDVGRVITGKIALDRRPLDLGEHVRHVAATLGGAGRLQKHHLALDVADAWIDGDATRIEQVITNLLVNALTYTPPNGHVTVAARREGDEAVLVVADDGEGIAPEALPHLFDLFYQGDQTLGRARGGLGIGLTLVRRLTELHGGAVAAESAGRGLGSRFVVRFPARPAPAARAQPERAGPALVPVRRVLVVEDNDDARRTLRQLLELKGHIVCDAPDGPSGLLAAREFRPEVALVDIGMPGMNGYEVAHALRAQHGPGLRLIAVSGYGLPDHRRRALEAGFEVHLVKPVNADALDSALAAPVTRAA